MSASEDQADVERVLAGDVSAFEGIVRRWQSPLINLAFRFFRDRDRAVRRMVFALPPKYRDALILFYFHDLDVPAAARSLGLPEGTVKARLSRGREILRSKLPRLLSAPHLKEA